MGPLSGATTLSQSGPRSNGNEGVLHIPQNPSITRVTIRLFNVISKTLIAEESYPSAETQLVYSMAPAYWAETEDSPEDFLIRQVVCEDIQYFSYKMRKGQFLSQAMISKRKDS